MDSMTLDEAINKFKKFDNDLPEKFRISRQDILNGDVKKLIKAYRILAMKYHPDRNSLPEAEEKFKEMKSVYEFLIVEAEYYQEKKKVSDPEEAKREKSKEKKTYDDQDTFEEKIIDLEKQREQGSVQKIINMLTGKSTQGGAISKGELQKIVKRIRRKKIPLIKDEKQRFEYQNKLYLITKIYKLIKGGRFDESKSLECFNRLMDLETSIDNVLMAQELEGIEKSPMIRPDYGVTSVIKERKTETEPSKEPLQLGPGPKPGEYSPIIRPDYTGTSRPKGEGPVITPPPKKPLQLGPEVSEPEPNPEPEPKTKKQKTRGTGIPRNLWIPLLQFFAFILGIYLLLFTPYWIFGLPLVIAGILLLIGVQSEREGLRELFDWFLHDDTGNKWGMILVVGIGSLIVYFQLGPIIAAIPLLVIFTYFAFGKKVVGDGHFVEYVTGLSGATIVLYYFFGYYVAAIPLLLVIIAKIFGRTALGEHFTEFIMTGTGIVLFIGGAQYAASYLYVTFSWPLLVGFGLFNAMLLIALWSMEEGGGNAEKDKAETEEARAATKYYESKMDRQDKNLDEWKEGAEKEKLKTEKEVAEEEKKAAKAKTDAAEAEEEVAKEN